MNENSHNMCFKIRVLISFIVKLVVIKLTVGILMFYSREFVSQ